jgi:hypothetical protein
MTTAGATTSATAVPDLPMGLTLEPDYHQIPGQNFALVSFVGPEFCRQKSGRHALKIRGVFATEEEAKAYVQRLQRSGDNAVDIFLMSMYQWAPSPPDPMAVENQEYQEQFLQDLMSGYAANQRSAKEVFNERKERVMKEGLDATLTDEERIPRPSKSLPTPDKLPAFTAETTLAKPEVVESDAVESEVAKPVAVEVAKPEAVEPDAVEPEVAKTDAVDESMFSAEDVWMKSRG